MPIFASFISVRPDCAVLCCTASLIRVCRLDAARARDVTVPYISTYVHVCCIRMRHIPTFGHRRERKPSHPSIMTRPPTAASARNSGDATSDTPTKEDDYFLTHRCKKKNSYHIGKAENRTTRLLFYVPPSGSVDQVNWLSRRRMLLWRL